MRIEPGKPMCWHRIKLAVARLVKVSRLRFAAPQLDSNALARRNPLQFVPRPNAVLVSDCLGHGQLKFGGNLRHILTVSRIKSLLQTPPCVGKTSVETAALAVRSSARSTILTLLCHPPPLTPPSAREIMVEPGIRKASWTHSRPVIPRSTMTDFNRKVEDASARVSQTIGNAAERLEKEIPEFIKYLNDEVVPAVRTHSTKALRAASKKLTEFADYMEQHQHPPK